MRHTVGFRVFPAIACWLAYSGISQPPRTFQPSACCFGCGRTGRASWMTRAAFRCGRIKPPAPRSTPCSTLLRRPRRVEPVASLAGRPALQFDGQDDFLHLPRLRIGSQTTVILSQRTASRQRAEATGAVLSGDDDRSLRRCDEIRFQLPSLRLGASVHRQSVLRSGQTASADALGASPSLAGFHMYILRRQGESAEGMTLRVDGAAAATRCPPQPAWVSRCRLHHWARRRCGQGETLCFYRGRSLRFRRTTGRWPD